MSSTSVPTRPEVRPGAGVRPPRQPSGESARALLAEKPDPRTRAIRLLSLVVAFILLVAGWQVTGIDLPKLVANLPNAGHVIRGLVTPDLTAREKVHVELSAPFAVGAGAAEPTSGAVGGQSFRAEPGAIQPGEYLTVEASGFSPSSTGQLRLAGPNNFNIKLQDVVVDDSGALKTIYQGEPYDVSFQWPAGRVPEGTYQLQLGMDTETGRVLPSETAVLALSKMGETILLALMGTVLGVLLSVPLSFFGAHNLMSGSPIGMAVYYVVRTVFNLGRSIEILILAVIMTVIVGIGSFAGVMAIVLHSIGAMGKLYSEAIESIDPGPIEAVTATGASRFQTVLYAVVPQVVPQFLAFTMYRWDTNVRMSTVIGLVGGGGIGYLLQQYMALLQWDKAATCLWLIAFAVMAMDYASAEFRKRIV